MTPAGALSGATSVFAVVGDPVRHSLSPRIHNRWIREAGLDAVYVALNLSSGSAAADLAALARAGMSGLNITLPHKIAALEAALSASPVVRRIGAANTLVREGQGWAAHNTDVDGFRDALALARPQGVAGASVLVNGAGGAARAAVHVLATEGARITVVNRTRETAEALRADLAPGCELAGPEDLERLAATTDLLVETTSAGHSGTRAPDLPAGRGRPYLHLSYGDAAAMGLSTAARAGWTCHDGLPMLVGQARAAFTLWFGTVPDMQTALADCRNALAVSS
jgi:shikimate dehydrogenase